MKKLITVDITVRVKIEVSPKVEEEDSDPEYICNELDYEMKSTVDGTSVLKTEFTSYDIVKVENV